MRRQSFGQILRSSLKRTISNRNSLLITALVILIAVAPASGAVTQSITIDQAVTGFSVNKTDMGRGLPLVDFESGTANLLSYEGEDADPNAWEIQSQNTYDGSNYALRLWGNTWKELAIDPHPITAASVFQAALYTEEIGELHAIGFGDVNGTVLFYDVSGEQVMLADNWDISYQGAYPAEEWYAYRFPVGQDWLDTFGNEPEITRIVFVNDHDGIINGVTVFDEVYDVTDDLPIAPTVEIQEIVGPVTKLDQVNDSGKDLFELELQFQGLVFDPDSDQFTFAWDFGDGSTSDQQNTAHTYTATADYTFTVSLDVSDETGLFGRDTCQVTIDPAGGTDDGIYTINFTGDIFLGRSYETPGGLIDTYGVEYLFEPTKSILGEDADVTMVNAEVAFTDQGTPHPTKSVVFRTRPGNIVGLSFAGVDIASTGNNHITDYGLIGLLDTHEMLDSVGIIHGGSGTNSYFALQPTYFTHQGIRLAFLNFCNRTGRLWNEQPFLDAGYDKCGFGWWNEQNNLRALEEANNLADLVIAFPHSGGEYHTTPPEPGEGGSFQAGNSAVDFDHYSGDAGIDQLVDPELCPPHIAVDKAAEGRFGIWPGLDDRTLRQHAIDNGAAAVLNAHPHVLQGFEIYNGALIAHSLGNFMFDLSYIETMPTMVLKASFSKNSIERWSFKPAFIDDWIPRPSSGRLGREISDRLADYSRCLGANVGVNPFTAEGVIFTDPETIVPIVASAEGTQSFVADGDHYISLPIEAAGSGNLSRIVDITGVPLEDCEICWGREVLWFGRFEQSEGYHIWNMNSDWEGLDNEVFQEGMHSLRLTRESDATGNVVTLLERHIPADSLRYNLQGWMKTENANEAKFSLRFYNSRYTWSPIATIDMGPGVTGDTDWTYYSKNLYNPTPNAPQHWHYLNVRANLNPPDDGVAKAWFDDLRVVEWLPWQPAVLPLEVPYPNNYRFIQIRVPAEAGAVTVSYEETRLTEDGVSSTEDSLPLPRSAVSFQGASPNPFRSDTTIRYQLSGAAHVSLEIFDLNGRLVEQLTKNQWQRPGNHSVTWMAPAQSAGIYFSRLSVDGESYSRKIVLMK